MNARSVLTHGLCALIAPAAYEVAMRLLGRSTLDPTHHRRK